MNARIYVIDKHNAILYRKDGPNVNLYSDKDIYKIIEIMCLPIGYVGTFESYANSLEDTCDIAS